MTIHDRFTLLVSASDRTGIVATIASFLHARGCNIAQVDQSVDAEDDSFRMRMVIDPIDLDRSAFEGQLQSLAHAEKIDVEVRHNDHPQRVAILCTHEPHCLHDLLQRHDAGELACEIPLVVSNHNELEPIAGFFGVRFLHIPVTADTKVQAESQLRAALSEAHVDLVVLARYMQVLSEAFVNDYTQQIINIHHSFLPAFAGASPYRQAHDRGVKLIGATAHFVTAALDEGPIIAQDVIACSHRDGVSDLVRKGRDIERTVLGRAVRWQLEHRLLVQDERVVVFR